MSYLTLGNALCGVEPLHKLKPSARDKAVSTMQTALSLSDAAPPRERPRPPPSQVL